MEFGSLRRVEEYLEKNCLRKQKTERNFGVPFNGKIDNSRIIMSNENPVIIRGRLFYKDRQNKVQILKHVVVFTEYKVTQSRRRNRKIIANIKEEKSLKFKERFEIQGSISEKEERMQGGMFDSPMAKKSLEMSTNGFQLKSPKDISDFNDNASIVSSSRNAGNKSETTKQPSLPTEVPLEKYSEERYQELKKDIEEKQKNVDETSISSMMDFYGAAIRYLHMVNQRLKANNESLKCEVEELKQAKNESLKCEVEELKQIIDYLMDEKLQVELSSIGSPALSSTKDIGEQ